MHKGRYPELRTIFAIPNGGMRNKIIRVNAAGKRSAFSPEGVKQKKMGVLPGVADLFLPAPRPTYSGLFLELKAGDGDISKEQREFLLAVSTAGYLSFVAWSAEDAWALIKSYLDLPPVDIQPPKIWQVKRGVVSIRKIRDENV